MTPLAQRPSNAVITLDEAAELSGHSLSRVCRAIDADLLPGTHRRRRGRTTVGAVRTWVLQGAPHEAAPGDVRVPLTVLERLVETAQIQAQYQRQTLGDHKGVAAATERVVADGYQVLHKAKKEAET